MFSVKDRIALITGAGSGIGRATALLLAQAGAHVAAVDLNADTAEETAKSVRSHGRNALAVRGDVSEAESARWAARAVLEHFGRVDILVNNAGIIRDARADQMEDWQWDAVLNTNLKGPFMLSREVLPSMRGNRYGRIINISSRVYLGNYGQANYVAAKAGLVGLSRTLALENARLNITVNTVAPGTINTAGTRAWREQAPEVFEKFMRGVPAGRLGDPSEVANAILFFASDQTGYITGQTMFVCGGWSIGAAQ